MTFNPTNPFTYIEINKEALTHNILQYKNILNSNTLFAPVIKSNAYGHGLKEIARICDSLDTVDFLCVFSLNEAIQLRKWDIQKSLLVLSVIDIKLLHALQDNAIHLTIYDEQSAYFLNHYAHTHNQKISIHIKIDTGLTRLGIHYTHALNSIERIALCKHLNLVGIFSHFSDSENYESTYTHTQITRFNTILTALSKKGIHIPLQHISCSAALSTKHTSHYSFARAGIGIFGLWSSLKNKQKTHQLYPYFNLKPVLTWKTHILQIHSVSKNTVVGYAQNFITQRKSRIATIPVGYWDGYDRSLSQKSHVLIREEKALIVGLICMNIMMIDITHISSAKKGDEVILLGNYPGISADDFATALNTINYEVVTRINPFIKRVIR